MSHLFREEEVSECQGVGGRGVLPVEVRTSSRWVSVQLGPREGEQSGEDMAWAVDLSSFTDPPV